MTTPFTSLLVAALILVGVQFVAAIPWLWALNRRGFVRTIQNPSTVGYAVVAVGGTAALFAWLMSEQRAPKTLNDWGRYYGAILHAQLALDFLILAPQLLLLIWPKGGAIALATFRECWRQPMFWLLTIIATFFIGFMMVVPFFTFGEDYKMYKNLVFDFGMVFPAIFGVLAASISIHDEIEGKTAITVMSKPVNRRQFLIGKYLGTLMGCWAMVLILGWMLTWGLYIKPFFDPLDDVIDTMPTETVQLINLELGKLVPTAEGTEFGKGVSTWVGETLAHHVGIVLTFGQVMVLLSICVALATRVTFVVNLVICLFVFIIGHLAPVLVKETSQLAQEAPALKLVSFIAQLFNVVFPALDYFNIGPAIIRESDVPMRDFAIYVGTVYGYAILYSCIGLIIGLLMFEDRDLA
jgi:hypothetical protein